MIQQHLVVFWHPPKIATQWTILDGLFRTRVDGFLYQITCFHWTWEVVCVIWTDVGLRKHRFDAFFIGCL